MMWISKTFGPVALTGLVSAQANLAPLKPGSQGYLQLSLEAGGAAASGINSGITTPEVLTH